VTYFAAAFSGGDLSPTRQPQPLSSAIEDVCFFNDESIEPTARSDKLPLFGSFAGILFVGNGCDVVVVT
jgi:hypothetical protein